MECECEVVSDEQRVVEGKDGGGRVIDKEVRRVCCLVVFFLAFFRGNSSGEEHNIRRAKRYSSVDLSWGRRRDQTR